VRPENEDDVEGGVATEEPATATYDEGHVESLHAGVGQGRDEDPRTGEGIPAETDDPHPKLSDRTDPFISSEVADRLPPKSKTTS
jgi:hypothetical protein